MNEAEILKYHNYTLQELGVLTFHSAEQELIFQDAYMGVISYKKNYSQKEIENRYSYCIAKKVVRRLY